MEILKLLQPYSQGSLLLALRSSVGRVGENPGNEVETFIAICIPVQSRAVASMRRTEALASVKFYQILSIFIFFIRLIILEDFIRLISYNGPCVRLGCSFFLATALQSGNFWHCSYKENKYIP